MEIAVDVTQTVRLQDGLIFAHHFLETIVSTSMDGIFAVNNKGKVTLFNKAARRLFKIKDNQIISPSELALMLPKGFLAKVSENPRHVYLRETNIQALDGETLPVRLIGNRLIDNDKSIAVSVFNFLKKFRHSLRRHQFRWIERGLPAG